MPFAKKGQKRTASDIKKIKDGCEHRRKELAVLDAVREAMFDLDIAVGAEQMPYYKVFIRRFLANAAKDPDSLASRIVAEMIFKDDTIKKLDESWEKEIARDTDFVHYRLFKNVFDLQREVLFDKSRKKIMICGRRSGKTECDAALLVDACVAKGAKTLYVGQTFTDAIEMIMPKVLRFADAIDLAVAKSSKAEGRIEFANGSEVLLRGNANAGEREKLQGKFYDLIVIDEIQSQRGAKYLIETICEPMLVDRGGSLVLSGSPPRVPHTFAEAAFNGEVKGYKTFNWNLTRNPFIKDAADALEKIKEEKGLTESDTVFQREYLGKFVYDTEAIVFKPTDDNYVAETEMREWCKRKNLALFGGLDYGYEDATACCVVGVDRDAGDARILFEEKRRQVGVSDIVAMLKHGVDFVKSLDINEDAKRSWYWHADTSAKNVSFELANGYGFQIADAYKVDKSFAVDQLRDFVHSRRLKFRRDGAFADECNYTIFTRDKNSDAIVHEIDDDVYHPDMMDALLYAMRMAFWELGLASEPEEKKWN